MDFRKRKTSVRNQTVPRSAGRTALFRLRIPVESVAGILALDHYRIDGVTVERWFVALDRDVRIALLGGFGLGRPTIEGADGGAVDRDGV